MELRQILEKLQALREAKCSGESELEEMRPQGARVSRGNAAASKVQTAEQKKADECATTGSPQMQIEGEEDEHQASCE